MKIVKLTAKPNTWFKSGSEVFHYDSTEDNKQKVTLDEWNEMVNDGMYCLRGMRICESIHELHKIGEEYFDGECGFPGEFEVEILDI